MHLLSILPLKLLKLPFKLRFYILVSSCFLCLIIYAFLFSKTQNGTIIVVPVIVASWLFGHRGTFICAAIINLFAIGLTCIILRTIYWPTALIVTTFIGIVASILIGLIFSYLRYSFTLAESNRLKALEAKQQEAIAVEQRLEALQAKQHISLAYEHERQLNILKDQFIVNVNHEFRTPLTEVFGYLELLVDHFGKLDEAMQTTFLHKALAGCHELILLVNTVLDSIQVGKGVKPILLEAVSVSQVIEEVLALIEPRKVQEYAIHLEIAEGLAVWADAQFVRQVLRNLLSNAMKYSPKQTSIFISALKGESPTSENTSSSQVCISVKDEGPGIPPNEVALLFGKFVRLQRDLSGSVRGTGLGLYISKQLVESMNGHIWVESSGQNGEGSRFCFTLPSSPSIAPSPSDLLR